MAPRLPSYVPLLVTHSHWKCPPDWEDEGRREDITPRLVSWVEYPMSLLIYEIRFISRILSLINYLQLVREHHDQLSLPSVLQSLDPPTSTTKTFVFSTRQRVHLHGKTHRFGIWVTSTSFELLTHFYFRSQSRKWTLCVLRVQSPELSGGGPDRSRLLRSRGRGPWYDSPPSGWLWDRS